MGWIERDDGWFTWWECPRCQGKTFIKEAFCPHCGMYLGKPGEYVEHIAKDIAENRNVTVMSGAEVKPETVSGILENVVKELNVKVKTEKGTKRMKNENVYMLQYVAGALHGISLMIDEDDSGELKQTLSSLSEEVSNVVISETIDREEEKPKVNIYLDDEGDDGK